MCFRPDDVPKGEVALEPVDTSAVALKWLSPPTSSFRMYASNFRGFSGTTHGELEMPETAPLIYPDTGYVEIGKKKNDKHGDGSFSKRKVAAAYFDKRAQAKYASLNLSTRLEDEMSTVMLTSLHIRLTSIPTLCLRQRTHHNLLPSTATRLTHP